MCGRFVRYTTPMDLAALYEIQDAPTAEASYNIVPTESIVTIRLTPEINKKEFALLKWGLVPSWAKDIKIGNKMINARAETVAEKPSFRVALRKRRCLIIADGFYEWQRSVKPSRPHYFKMKDSIPFAIAGIWEQWEDPDKKVIETCALLTTQANELMQPVHDRMPVILDPANYDLWLDRSMQEVEKLAHLYSPFSTERMETYEVSTIVNAPKNNDPLCIKPLER